MEKLKNDRIEKKGRNIKNFDLILKNLPGFMILFGSTRLLCRPTGHVSFHGCKDELINAAFQMPSPYGSAPNPTAALVSMDTSGMLIKYFFFLESQRKVVMMSAIIFINNIRINAYFHADNRSPSFFAFSMKAAAVLIGIILSLARMVGPRRFVFMPKSRSFHK